MPANEYHVLTHWSAPDDTPEAVFAVLRDPLLLPVWWPAVYREVTPVAERLEAFDLLTKGWLPYTLRWRLVAQGADPPHTLRIGAEGDFVGRGIWTLTPDRAGGTALTFDWRLLAQKPLLRVLSPLLKPLFVANHRWAMARGQISLLRELARRRARNRSERRGIPPPPPATTWEPWVALAGVAALVTALGIFLARRRQG